MKKDLKLGQARFCEQEVALFTPEDSLKILKLDFGQSQEKILQKIEKSLGKNSCDKCLEFGLLIGQGEVTKFILCHACNQYLELCIKRYPKIDLWLYRNGKILMDCEFGDGTEQIDSAKDITAIICNKFIFHERRELATLSLRWEEGTSSDKITHLINAMHKAYVKLYERFARENFQKSLCSLDSLALVELRDKFDLQLRFGNWDARFHPPQPLEY